MLDEAGLGHLSKNTASQPCRELRARYAAFCAKSLTDVELLALFLDAVHLPTRPSGAKEGVLVVWGYRLNGERVLLAVRLGQSLCWAVLDLVIDAAHGLSLTDLDRQYLSKLAAEREQVGRHLSQIA